MIDVALGVILNLLAFFAIGIGPALVFLSSEKRLEVALAIAPAFGFALSSVFGTYLVLLDKPVGEWVIAWLVISILISTILSFTAFKKYQLKLSLVNWQLLKVFAVGLVLTTILVLLPMVLGGSDFTTLRGNGSDTFNYIALAGYLDHEPYSWASKVDVQTLGNRHFSYPLAKILLSTRWTTSAMLSLTSRIAGLPIYYFEYGFTALCFIFTVGSAFWLALSTNLKPLYGMLLSVAIAVGFWGQFVLDIRAMSHINSIPILLLLGLLISRIEANRNIASGEIFLLPIVFLSLILFYVEIVPMVILGLAIFWGTLLTQKVLSFSHFKVYLPSLGLTVLGLLPVLNFVLRFFTEQVQFASSIPKDWNWDKAFFSWFYENPINGLWGLPYIEVSKTFNILLIPNIINASLTSLSVILLLVLIYGFIKLLITKGYPEATLLSASWALASLTQFLVLLLRQQFWAAGKGLSFGYPYFMISLVTFALTSSSLRTFNFSIFLSKVIKFAVITWLLIQCLLGSYRISFAFKNPEYPNYIWHHGEYRGHDWNTKQFKILQEQSGLTVWLLVSNSWVAEYLGFALGWNAHLVNLFDVRESLGMRGDNSLRTKQSLSQIPDYVIVEKTLWQNIDDVSSTIVTKNSELMLVKTSPDFWKKPLLLAIENPNGLEFAQGEKTWFWMGGQPTQLKIFAPIKGKVNLKARFFMGPSLPEQAQRRLSVSSSADDKPQELVIKEGIRDINLSVNVGINEITLQTLDEPTIKVLPTGDSRPMLLGVEKLQIKPGRADN